jgi:predicted nuclease with TOPRIM domain
MPIDGRDKRNGTMARELADEAELAKARAEVEALRQLHERIEQRQLEPGDWERLRAVLDETYAELESCDDSRIG